ncbi:MAG: hypothetical protein V1835_05980 [Candidatus Micrarchaeota archaeon]
MRGQIFSIDFVIAMAILTISIGVTMQTFDTIQKRMGVMEQVTVNSAEVDAYNRYIEPISLFENPQGRWPGSPLYDDCTINSTGASGSATNIGAVSCYSSFCPGGTTYSATRLSYCTIGGARRACAITIKTCA